MEQNLIPEAQRLKGIVREALTEKERVEGLRKAVSAEVTSSIRDIYEEGYRALLESAASEGKNSVILYIDPDFGAEDPATRDVRAKAIEESLKVFLEEEGLTVEVHPGGSHGDFPGLLVSWS